MHVSPASGIIPLIFIVHFLIDVTAVRVICTFFLSMRNFSSVSKQNNEPWPLHWRQWRRFGVPKSHLRHWSSVYSDTSTTQTPLAAKKDRKAPTSIPSLTEVNVRLRKRKKIDPQKFHYFLLSLIVCDWLNVVQHPTATLVNAGRCTCHFSSM